jgi:hypothetical protein
MSITTPEELAAGLIGLSGLDWVWIDVAIGLRVDWSTAWREACGPWADWLRRGSNGRNSRRQESMRSIDRDAAS